MSARQNRPPNRWGCKPTEDVCVEHDEPLICRHGCEQCKPHECKDYEPAGASGRCPVCTAGLVFGGHAPDCRLAKVIEGEP